MSALLSQKLTPELCEQIRVLLVEDNLSMRTLILTVLRMLGIPNVKGAASTEQAMVELEMQEPDIALVDCDNDPKEGPRFIHEMRRVDNGRHAELPVILLSAYADRQMVERARSAGANDLLVKPFSPRVLLQHIAYVMENPRATVQAESYIGPDRRQQMDENFKGDERRGVEGDGDSGETGGEENGEAAAEPAGEESEAQEETG
ncbi:MAG: response regulator [Alphaproteobacteria bacterium]|jgi:CheY-like chemotaxis protein|nr:response regulator [Alphaproteobacteria bacterium]